MKKVLKGHSKLPTIADIDYSQTEGIKALIDYFCFTVPYDLDLEHDVVGTILDLDFSEFELEQGANFCGYRKVYKKGNIRVCTDGVALKNTEDVNTDMGHYVHMSGQGCREYEDILQVDRWTSLIGYIFGFNGKLTRIDLAIDDFTGYFSIDDVVDYCNNGLYSGLFRTGLKIEKTRLKDGLKIGKSYYMGSPSSDAQMYFYEKNWERVKDEQTVWAETLPFWNRTEMRLRKEKANDVAREIYDHPEYNFGYIVGKVFNKYCRFLKPNANDKNTSRWETADFWLDFIGHAEKIDLSTKKPDRNIDTVENYIEHQASRNMLLLALAKQDRFVEIMQEAFKKLKPEDEEILLKQINENELIEMNRNERKELIKQKLMGNNTLIGKKEKPYIDMTKDGKII